MNFFTELAEVSSYVMVLDTSFRILVIVEDNKRDVRGREKQLIMPRPINVYFILNGGSNR